MNIDFIIEHIKKDWYCIVAKTTIRKMINKPYDEVLKTELDVYQNNNKIKEIDKQTIYYRLLRDARKLYIKFLSDAHLDSISNDLINTDKYDNVKVLFKHSIKVGGSDICTNNTYDFYGFYSGITIAQAKKTIRWEEAVKDNNVLRVILSAIRDNKLIKVSNK